MSAHELAGKPAPPRLLVNLPKLITAYFAVQPDPSEPLQRVSFGTSGHRGSSLEGSFNQDHILAITQAICDWRVREGIDGPLFLGMDTHALSESAHTTALEVLAANEMEVRVASGLEYTPTPVISHSILGFNRAGHTSTADGIVITPSHNPPSDGGFKYNPPHGGPAGTETTQWVQERANQLLEQGLSTVRRVPLKQALQAETTQEFDFIESYVSDLGSVVDMDSIRASGLRIGADPMGGSGVHYWNVIAERFGLNIEVVNPEVDATFRFMTVDRDGKIRMDCSSASAMASLIRLKDRFDLAFGNDPDFDRHGIVTPAAGLLNPNHYLAVAIWYLFQNRDGWSRKAKIGKTLVSSSMIDRVAKHLGRELSEVPVGFKWFVDGLISGEYGFGGEESAGASFLRKDGSVWTTDKDGFLLNLLAAEILAVTGTDPGQHYQTLSGMFGVPIYERIQAPATRVEKAALKALSPEQVKSEELAGEKILNKLTSAPGNGAEIGGLKIVTENGWFAARPSGTEDIYKIYAESFRGPDHLRNIQAEAQEMVTETLKGD
jgi:phosphoglucomutase